MTEKTTMSRGEQYAAMRRERNAKILEAAITLAKENGYQWITRQSVAILAGVSEGSVSNAFKTVLDLKREVMRQAVERGIPEIVAQGLADGSTIARDAPPDLRQRAIATL